MNTLIKTALLAAGLVCATSISAFAKEEEEQEVAVKLSDCPSAVQKTLKREAFGGKVEEVDRVSTDKGTFYEAEVEIEGEDYEVVVSKSGKLIHKLLVEEEDEEHGNESAKDDGREEHKPAKKEARDDDDGEHEHAKKSARDDDDDDEGHARGKKNARNDDDDDDHEHAKKEARDDDDDDERHERRERAEHKEHEHAEHREHAEHEEHEHAERKQRGHSESEEEEHEVPINFADCPKPVQKTLKLEANGAKIGKVDRISREGKTFYETDVELGGRNYEILAAQDGTLIHKKLDEDEGGEEDRD